MNIQAMLRAIVVVDLEQSIHFYQSVFGFIPTEFFEGDDAVLSVVTQLENVNLRAQIMENSEGVKIELVQFLHPQCYGSCKADTLDHTGLTHLAFFVENVDETREKVIDAGGYPLDDTRVMLPVLGMEMDGMFVSDPNGVRIELVAGPDVPAQFMWNGICVRDLDKAVSFYQTLGFEPAEIFDYRDTDANPWVSQLNGIPEVSLFIQVMRDDQGHAVELIEMLKPQPRENTQLRDYNLYGLANLAFFVDDRDSVGEQLQAVGADMFESTRINMRDLKQWHGADPNGARIELVQHPE